MENNELLQSIASMMEAQTEHFDNEIRRLELKMEHEVSNKIEALFDGYKLTHEKQWEMDRKMNELERRIERLEQVG